MFGGSQEQHDGALPVTGGGQIRLPAPPQCSHCYSGDTVFVLIDDFPVGLLILCNRCRVFFASVPLAVVPAFSLAADHRQEPQPRTPQAAISATGDGDEMQTSTFPWLGSASAASASPAVSLQPRSLPPILNILNEYTRTRANQFIPGLQPQPLPPILNILNEYTRTRANQFIPGLQPRPHPPILNILDEYTRTRANQFIPVEETMNFRGVSTADLWRGFEMVSMEHSMIEANQVTNSGDAYITIDSDTDGESTVVNADRGTTGNTNEPATYNEDTGNTTENNTGGGRTVDGRGANGNTNEWDPMNVQALAVLGVFLTAAGLSWEAYPVIEKAAGPKFAPLVYGSVCVPVILLGAAAIVAMASTKSPKVFKYSMLLSIVVTIGLVIFALFSLIFC